ncbi:MAG: hypothetical protein AAGG51_08890 [Cyanobacteria bacterium P01_G01_bin.54]
MDTEVKALIKSKAELLLNAIKNNRVIRLKHSFSKDNHPRYLPIMHKGSNQIVKCKGKIKSWTYVGCSIVNDLYSCKYLINFDKGEPCMIFIYLDQDNMNYIRFDFLGEQSLISRHLEMAEID